MTISVDEPAQLTITDPTGAVTGWDHVAKAVVQNAANAFYRSDQLVDTDNEEPVTAVGRFMDVVQPSQGTYVLTATGIEAGVYTIQINSFDSNGTSQTSTSYNGIAMPDSTATLQIHTNPAPNAGTSVTLVATFQSTLADIANSLSLKMINNTGIAAALTEKIKEAASAVKEHESDDARETLNAFRHQVNAQAASTSPELLHKYYLGMRLP